MGVVTARNGLAMPTTAEALDAWSLRRRALWGLLAAKLVGGWGLGWDIRWHLLIGRDSFWIPPHVLTYAAVVAAALLSLGVLAAETRAARRGGRRDDTLSIAGLSGTRGYHLAWWGTALTILAAPIDDLWHRLFGIDVTLWSPPHLLGLAGAQVNTLGCLVIARELWPHPGRERTLAHLVGATLFLGTFEIALDPSGRIAFLYGSVLFYTWPILGAPLLGFALAFVARLAAWRSLPLFAALGAIVVQVSLFVVADVGFALTRPVSVIEEVIREDPTSPIAVAHEMARRRGAATPGRSLASRMFPVLPAALLVALDASRRPGLAGAAFGGALWGVYTLFARGSPALAHAHPTAGESAVAVVATLALAVAGTWLGGRLGAALDRARR
jgi:hypothetical protein